MDAQERKYFAQLDDPMPGQRQNALDLLRALLAKNGGRKFVDIVNEIETAETAAQTIAALQGQVAFLNGELQKARAVNAQARRAWLRAVGLKAFAQHWWPAAAVGVLALGGLLVLVDPLAWWSKSTDTSSWWSNDDGAFQKVATQAAKAAATQCAWQESDVSCTQQWANSQGPRVEAVNDKSYWVLFKVDWDRSSYVDASGKRMPMACVHVYGTRAESTFGVFKDDPPRNPFGAMRWPERAMACAPPTPEIKISGESKRTW